jgi:hypothetical protein
MSRAAVLTANLVVWLLALAGAFLLIQALVATFMGSP